MILALLLKRGKSLLSIYGVPKSVSALYKLMNTTVYGSLKLKFGPYHVATSLKMSLESSELAKIKCFDPLSIPIRTLDEIIRLVNLHPLLYRLT